jgi:glycine/D-amino acid oxidase-like deaminating enzyme
MANYDAIVVGGGVVGMSAAYQLVRAGATTLLLDRADRGRATDAGAGILSGPSGDDDTGPLERFKTRAAQYYPELIERLHADAAGDTGYAVTGSLTVAVDDDELAPFERLRASSGGSHAELSARQARALFPPLGKVHGALHATEDARVDGRLLAGALRRAATARGLVLREAGVERLLVRDDTVQGVVVDAEETRAAHVVLAAGAWSAALGEQLGIRIPVEPQRGQIVHLRLDGVETGAWPVVLAFRRHYMVAWPGGRVVAGATRETGSGFRPESTVAGVMQVLGEALRVAPGLQAASVEEIRVGLRPASPDGLPILGRVPGVRNLLLATGHGPSGLLLGPYSGKVIAESVAEGAQSAELAAFGVDRFW